MCYLNKHLINTIELAPGIHQYSGKDNRLINVTYTALQEIQSEKQGNIFYGTQISLWEIQNFER